jgi:hypothetical protein
MSKITPERILAVVERRCEEDGDCLLWTGAVSSCGAPVMTFTNDLGKKPTLQMRRKVWEARTGKKIPKGRYVTYTCNNPKCLEHLELTTRAEITSRYWTRPDSRARLTAAATRVGRTRAKASMEVAREIRASSETLEVLAARYGISISLVSLIRRGERWKEERNPFAGLVASNDSNRRAA